MEMAELLKSKFYLCRVILSLVAGISLSSRSALANESSDISFRMGAAVGSLLFIDEAGKTVQASFGGIPLSGQWHKETSPQVAVSITVGTMLDLTNSQIIRQGVSGGIAYHLLGGPRHYEISGSQAHIVSSSPTALSLVSYVGLQNFAAVSKANSKQKVAGSVLEIQGGISYRYEWTERSAATLELTTTLFTLPASVARLSPATQEIMFGWRTYL